MARTQAQILAQINEEANRHAELVALQSNTSRVSIWAYVKQLAAFVVRTQEEMNDTHVAEVQALIANQQIGTAAWYAEQARRYQHGDNIRLINQRPIYNTDDPEARIITHVAVEEGTGNDKGKIFVKAVKAGTGEDAPHAPLDEVEKKAFQAYLNAITFAGLQPVAQSEAAVAITFAATIQVNEQHIIATGDAAGKRPGTDEKPVEAAVKAYLRNLPFNGILRRSAMEDAIQQVEGVVDVKLASLSGAASFTSTYKPASGHATLAEASTFTYQTSLIT